MKIFEPGILPQSELYFYEPGPVSRGLGLRLLRAGSFFCGEDYDVRREDYGSYLLLRSNAGKGAVETGGRSYPVNVGDFVLLDCYHKHRYYAKERWDFGWLHFEGTLADAFYEQIIDGRFRVFPAGGLMSLAQRFDQLIRGVGLMRNSADKAVDAEIARLLLSVLGDLLSIDAPHERESQTSSIIQEALSYIHRNPAEPMTVSQLASQASFSPYYFIRVFAQETGFTPYEYIKRFRLNLAKYYLRATSASVRDIARQCGFSEAGNFAQAFGRMTGMTPTQYRRNRCNPFE